MAVYQSKNKWNSQQIQKRYKNNKHNDYDMQWNKVSHNHALTNYCNEYVKNTYTNYNDDSHIEIIDEYEHNFYQPSYWRCNQCTYDNIEGDLYCFICKSHFNSSKLDTSTPSSPKYSSDTITFGDYLPSKLHDIIHTEDDIDESIQIAIFLSYEHTPNQQQQQQQIMDNYPFQKYKSCTTIKKRQSRKFRKKQIGHKLDAKQKLERRKIRSHLAKCLGICHKLQSMINANIMHGIQSRLKGLYGANKYFGVSLIATPKIVENFAVQGIYNDDFEIVYHGTDSKNAANIIENGLIVGGTRGIPIKHGTAYGRGIYCSPNAGTARSYEKGSMFICIVKNKMVRKSGAIWVVPKEQDILPLYLASFSRDSPYKPTPMKYLPNHAYDKSWREDEKKKMRQINEDYMGQNVIRFIPSFLMLNEKKKFQRKIQRKWSAYHKIKQYKSSK